MRTEAEIQEWLIDELIREFEMEKEEIDIHVPLSEYGVDSITIVELTSKLDDWLDINLDTTTMYDYGTIQALSGFVASQQKVNS